MSRDRPDRKPMIALVRRADRAFQQHMVESAHARGRTEAKATHDAVFAILGEYGERPADLAARAGITRQSMGEVIRDLVDLGILEMVPDPDDRRAKIVRYTPDGDAFRRQGFVHLRELERVFEEEFGAEYEAAREVLERITAMLPEATVRDLTP
jgi:DNA-binding MarR family transcriptional regulator